MEIKSINFQLNEYIWITCIYRKIKDMNVGVNFNEQRQQTKKIKYERR